MRFRDGDIMLDPEFLFYPDDVERIEPESEAHQTDSSAER